MRNSSTEGVLRFSYGFATGGRIGGVGTDGIEFRIAESLDWIGARVVLKINKKGEPYIDLLPQVGARRTAADEYSLRCCLVPLGGGHCDFCLGTPVSTVYPCSNFLVSGCQYSVDARLDPGQPANNVLN